MQKQALYDVLAEQVEFNWTESITRLFVSFPQKNDTPQLSWVLFSLSWLLCPPPCKSQFLEQGRAKQKEARGISAKVLSLGVARPMHGISGEEFPLGLLHSPLLAAAARLALRLKSHFARGSFLGPAWGQHCQACVLIQTAWREELLCVQPASSQACGREVGSSLG